MYLSYKKNLNQYWAFDIETNGFTPDKIWCIVLINIGTNERIRLIAKDGRINSEWKRFNEAHPDAILIAHFGLSFDIPVLNDLTDVNIRLDRTIDTVVLSYLYHPNMPGGHSIEAYGERFKTPKVGHTDWLQYSDEMLRRCEMDVEILVKVYKGLVAKMRGVGFSERSCQIEHQIRHVVNKQEKNGFAFNVEKAEQLLQHLRGEEARLSLSVRSLFPPQLVSQRSYEFRTRTDGTPYASYERHRDQYPELKFNDLRTEYTVYDWQEFNLGSPLQRVNRLLGLGYEPTKFTPTGQPKVDEESLVAFAESSGNPQVQELADWLVHNGRGNMVNTWLNNVSPDGRMRGRVFTCGAGTRRMTHKSPNTANIPKAKPKVRYGKECRELWTVADVEERRLVGYDAAGLEMRMFAHYLGDPTAAKLYIEGDPHQVNADMLGIDRDPVKNVFYAFLYGAANPKLGATAEGRDDAWGAWARKKLLVGTPGLDRLVKEIQTEHKTGWMSCIDGGYVKSPNSPHAALNYKLQSAGAITMKVMSIMLEGKLRRAGLDANKVADVHDEGIQDVYWKDAEECKRLAEETFVEAGESLNFSVPIVGEGKIGLTWAETH